MAYFLRKMIRGKVIEGAIKPQKANNNLHGKNAVVIGGTSGLGRAIADELVKNGARVTVVGRTDPKAALLSFIQADLSTVRAQRDLAEMLSRDGDQIDLLVFTQGILAPKTRVDNGEGIELDLAVSAIGRRVILDGLRESGMIANCRVFIMAFPGAEEKIVDLNGEHKYKSWPQHMNTVIVNDVTVLSYRKLYPGVEIYGLNPGLIRTGIRDSMYGNKRLMKKWIEGFIEKHTPTPAEYAANIMNVIGAAALVDVFFNQHGEAIHKSEYLSNDQTVEKIWNDVGILIEKASNGGGLQLAN